MKAPLKPLLWIKFVVVIILFVISFSLNFLIASTIEPAVAFNLLLWGKPMLVLIFIFFMNLLFNFSSKVSIPNIIPSTFLILSGLIFIDLGFLVWKYYAILTPHTIFWGVYGVLTTICTWNLQKYIRAFTVGIPD